MQPGQRTSDRAARNEGGIGTQESPPRTEVTKPTTSDPKNPTTSDPKAQTLAETPRGPQDIARLGKLANILYLYMHSSNYTQLKGREEETFLA